MADYENIQTETNIPKTVENTSLINNPLSELHNEITLSNNQKAEQTYSTLNESILETMVFYLHFIIFSFLIKKRDIIRIFLKMKYVLNPYIQDDLKPKLLLDWDLWGPLMFTIILSCCLAIGNSNKGELFVLVFTIFWAGSFIIYLNANLLEAKMTLFQTFSILGYCLFPLNIMAFIFTLTYVYDPIRFVMLIIACCWSSYSCIGFMKNIIGEEKKIMLLYPIILFYLFITWFILMNH